MKKYCILLIIILTLLTVIACKEVTIDQLADKEYLNNAFPGYSGTGIPTITIETPDKETITREEYIKNSSYQIEDSSGSVNDTIGIKGRGNSSWGNDKKGYNIKFNEKTSVLGMAEAKKWSLISNIYDKSLLRNWLSGYLAKSIKRGKEWSPSYEFADLVLNDEYMGTYAVAESIQINKKRLNIHNIEDYTDPEDFSKGGFILEIDFRRDATWTFTSDICKLPFTLKDPDFDDKDATVYVEYMKGIIRDVETKLTDPDFPSVDVGTIDYININSFIDWYILEEFAKNLDAYFLTSVYMYYSDDDHMIHMGPHWDFDNSFGSTGLDSDSDDYKSPEGYWLRQSSGSSTNWYLYLLSNESFITALKQRWSEIKYLFAGNTSVVDVAIDAKAEQIAKAAEYNFRRWKVMGSNIIWDALGFSHVSSFDEEVDSLKEWIHKRYEWLDKQWGE